MQIPWSRWPTKADHLSIQNPYQVHASIQREMIRQNGSMLSHTNGASSAAQAALWARKPWLTEPRDECQYKICPHCRPAAADRAYLSLNAIANGDIPPTAATGYGFHVMGERPVVDAEIVQVMEYRPAAKVCASAAIQGGLPGLNIDLI